MTFPRRASLALALLTLAALAAVVFPHGRASAQTAAAAPQKAPSPNGKIVFESDQAGDGFTSDIFVMDADGKRQTRLTDDAGDDVSPVWSPQGDKIAFLSTRLGRGYEIFLMSADGTNQHPLRADYATVAEAFEWSPNGQRLAYANPDDGNIYTVAVEGTDAATSVSDDKAPGSKDIEASWSPDGSRLVVRNNLVNAACSGGCTDLYTVGANGNGRAPLVTQPGFDTHARWSADGSYIAYVAERGSSWGLYVIDAAGAGPERKVTTEAVSLGVPAWSPVGSRLAFVALSGILYAVNADGTGLTALSKARVETSAVFWSPDASKVAFHNSNADNRVDIFVVNSDGSPLHAANYTKTRLANEFASSWQKNQ